MTTQHRCKDCVAEGITTKRKLATKRDGSLQPGPRCVTHQRARRSTTRDTAWESRLMKIYGITAEQYWAIYELQDRKCYICQRATGARKRLSVDHCHETGAVRGLLCSPCNKNVLGHLRDDPAAFRRALDYLNAYPAMRAGVCVITPDMRGVA